MFLEICFLLGECPLFIELDLLGKLCLHTMLLMQILLALILQLVEALNLVFRRLQLDPQLGLLALKVLDLLFFLLQFVLLLNRL